MIINPSQAHLQITCSPTEFTLLRRAMFMYGLAAISEARPDDLELIEEMNRVLDNVDKGLVYQLSNPTKTEFMEDGPWNLRTMDDVFRVRPDDEVSQSGIKAYDKLIE